MFPLFATNFPSFSSFVSHTVSACEVIWTFTYIVTSPLRSMALSSVSAGVGGTGVYNKKIIKYIDLVQTLINNIREKISQF